MPDPSDYTPTMQRLRVGGLAAFGTGGCLMWTVVLIPLALPIALIGLGMFIWSFFTPREVVACGVCGEAFTVEPIVAVVLCPHCRTSVKRSEGAWERVT